ncbi:hypothetical protein [Streptomyces sp. 3212.3]|nr:hypothetical protein [Streptomyces sp. 3212.3]
MRTTAGTAGPISAIVALRRLTSHPSAWLWGVGLRSSHRSPRLQA